MTARTILPLTALAAAALVSGAAAGAPSGQASKADRAKSFRLDSIAPGATPSPAATATPTPVLPAPDVPDTAPVAPAADAAPAATGALRPSFTLDTPIGVLIADPAARAVLDRDLPGMSTDENLDKFAQLGLRQFQPLTGGQLTEAMLAKVARDLSTLGGPLVAPVAPTRGGTSKRNHDASR